MLGLRLQENRFGFLLQLGEPIDLGGEIGRSRVMAGKGRTLQRRHQAVERRHVRRPHRDHQRVELRRRLVH